MESTQMKSIAATLIIASAFFVLAARAEAAERMPAQDEAAIRRVVYQGRARRIGSRQGLNLEVIVPAPLADLYVKQPDAVLDVLTEIIAGGNPMDSVTAAAYAISLLEGPAVGEVCIALFDKDHYDLTDDDWNCSPRQHWLKVTKQHRKK
jgi:hypothetical protein